MAPKIPQSISKIIEKIKALVKKGIGKLKGIDLSRINIKKINLAVIKRYYMWIVAGVLIFTMALTYGIGQIKRVFFEKGGDKSKKTVQTFDTVPVKVYKVKRMDFKDTLPVMGRIEGAREIDLKFDGKGTIESFNFEEGERILEGDIIASLDQKDALLKLKYASLDLEKTKKLYKLGAVDKLALDQKKLEYESSKRDLEKTNIYAPSDGYLGSKEKSVGTFVTSQDKIGEFVDFSEVYAAFDIIEEDSPKIKLGQNVEVFLDAFPGVSYKGTVDMISPMIEGRVRTQKVKVQLDNAQNEMKPGMFARGIINTYEKKNALIIPASSFKKKDNKFFIYVVHPVEKKTEETGKDKEKTGEKHAAAKPKKKKDDKTPRDNTGDEGLDNIGGQVGTVEVRQIEIAYLTHDVAEVSKGLKEGEMIIREIHREYKDKDKVEITEVQETIF